VLSSALKSARGSPLRRFDLVIFDCDGVIIDSEMISARILIGQLARAGIVIDFAHVRDHYFGRSFPKVSADIRKTFGIDLPGEFELEYRAALLETFETELQPMPGFDGMMAGLGIPSCVATSSSPPRARRSLELSGLERWFGNRVFTASQVANGKPAPDLFLFAARTLGADPARCLVIEDSLPGVDAALAAGMTVWRFTGGSHMRGAHGSHLHASGPLTIFDNWADFLEMAPDLRKAQAAQ
jgi:HAD superfamily hydrolase (TIGR01509 family)